MATPEFIMIKGSSSFTEKPYYIGLVQHGSVMSKKETYESLRPSGAFAEIERATEYGHADEIQNQHGQIRSTHLTPPLSCHP